MRIPPRPAAVLLLAALSLAFVSCSRKSNVAPPARLLRIAPRLTFVHANAGSIDTTPDSLTAEALNPTGQVVAGPVPLDIDFEAGTFSGTLDVPAGGGQRIRVTGFRREDVVYQGVSAPLTVGGGDTLSADVLLRPAIAVALRPSVAQVTFGDSVDFVITDTAAAGFSSLALGMHQVGAGLEFSRFLRGPDLPGNATMQAGVNAPGIIAPTHFTVTLTAGDTPLPSGFSRLAVMRFAACPGRTCQDGVVDSVVIDYAAANGSQRSPLPLTTHDAAVKLVAAPPQGADSACVSGVVRLGGVPREGVTVSTPSGSTQTAGDGSYCLKVRTQSQFTVTATYTSSTTGVNYQVAQYAATGAAAQCGSGCVQLDLALQHFSTPPHRYSPEVYFIRTSVGADSGTVYAFVGDESGGQGDTLANITVTPQGGSPVSLYQLSPGTFVGVGYRSPYYPFIPIDFGRRYLVSVDVDGNQTVDASGSVTMPPEVALTNPTEGSVQPSNFNMTWTRSVPTDSIFYYGFAEADTGTGFEYRYGFDVTSLPFDTLRVGSYQAELQAWSGPYLTSVLLGGFEPNLVGPDIIGYTWAYTDAPNVAFSVGSPAPRRDGAAHRKPERITPQIIRARLEALKRALSHPR